MDILLTLIEQAAMYTPLLLGSYCAFFLLKVPYLAVESAFVLGAFVAMLAFALPLSPTLLLCCAVGASLCGGASVGILTCAVRWMTNASFLLASIITMGLFHGINQFVVQGTHISLPVSTDIFAYAPIIPSYPQFFILLFIAFLAGAAFLLFSWSAAGIACGIYGDNPNFFAHYGISALFIQLVGIVVSSMLVALSGCMVAFMNGFADISMGLGVPLFAITALVLGRISVEAHRSFCIPLLGLIVYLVLQQTLLRINFDSRYFSMIQAFVVCILLFLIQYNKKTGRYHELGL